MAYLRAVCAGIFLSVLTSGCATPQNYSPTTVEISIPELNVETKASVGDQMVRQGSSTMAKGITLPEENNILNRKFSRGFYPQIGEDKKFTYHSFAVGQSLNGMGAVSISGVMDVESLRADKRKQELCVMSTMRVFAMGMTPCDTEHTFIREERPLIGNNNFQQSLIYSGRIGNSIKIGYREFSGNYARPAYSNEVQYDLDQSDVITYKGARIRVIQADNEGIRYIVLSNFNTSN